MKKLGIALALVLSAGTAMAQSIGNTGPGRADTTDPNSAPFVRSPGTRAYTTQRGLDAAGRANTADPNSAPTARSRGTRAYTTGRGLDPAGRANTSDPNSAMSGGTGAMGRPVNPTANPRRR